MSLSTSKKTTKTDQATTQQAQSQSSVTPGMYQPQVDAAASSIAPSFGAAQANNNGLLDRVNGAMDTSTSYYNDVIGGKYLDGNPHLQAVLDATNRDVTSGVNSQFESAGRYGSNYHADAIARAVAENEDKLRYGDYAAERQNQGQAATALPAVTGSLAGISSALPQSASSTYAAQIAALLGKYANSNSSGTTSGTLTGTNVEKSTPSIMDYLLQMQSNAAKAAAAGGA